MYAHRRTQYTYRTHLDTRTHTCTHIHTQHTLTHSHTHTYTHIMHTLTHTGIVLTELNQYYRYIVIIITLLWYYNQLRICISQWSMWQYGYAKPFPNIFIVYFFSTLHTHTCTAELSRPAIVDKRSRSTAAVLTHTFSGELGYPGPNCKEMDMQIMTMASPRHFLRRGGMVQDQLQDHLCSSKLVPQVRRHRDRASFLITRM